MKVLALLDLLGFTERSDFNRVFQKPPTRPQLMPQLSLNSGNLKPQLEVSDFRIRKLRSKLRYF